MTPIVEDYDALHAELVKLERKPVVVINPFESKPEDVQAVWANLAELNKSEALAWAGLWGVTELLEIEPANFSGAWVWPDSGDCNE